MTIDKLLLAKTELKHNVNLRLGMIFEPFTWMRQPDAVDDALFSLFGDRITPLEAKGEDVRLELDRLWYDKSDSPQKQMASFLTNATRFNNLAIPVIKETTEFYNSLLDYSNLFHQENPMGFRAYQSIGTARCSAISVLNDLKSLTKRDIDRDATYTKINLLSVLERSFDQIQRADVRYMNASDFCSIEVEVLEDVFVNDVLNNIKENISTHAFSTSQTLRKFVFDNWVRVGFEEKDDCFLVSVANNGTPFTGNYAKLFTPEYYDGQKGHSGYGLHSAREGMRRMGGDLSVITDTGDFVFTYLIKINKHNAV